MELDPMMMIGFGAPEDPAEPQASGARRSGARRR
jgi:hypothetical protein